MSPWYLPPRFFHTGGWNVLTTPFIHRGSAAGHDSEIRSRSVLQLCDEHGVSILFGVPTMMDMMYRSPAFADARLNELRYAVGGGRTHAPAPDQSLA